MVSVQWSGGILKKSLSSNRLEEILLNGRTQPGEQDESGEGETITIDYNTRNHENPKGSGERKYISEADKFL